MPEQHGFDGKSLLPLLMVQSNQHHDTLFWSKGPEDEWAVRRGDWKLHWNKGHMELINLADDPSETTNLADKRPDIARQLSAAFDTWIEPMPNPITGGAKRKDAPAAARAQPEQQ